MKVLYLIRHAKSDWDDPFQDDFDRPLNRRGRSDAPRMGHRLREQHIRPDLLLSSPAERALSTCMIIAENIGYTAKDIRTDERLYLASDDVLFDVIRGLNDTHKEVMIFSHNPGLTEVANRLNKEPFTDNIPTCGVVCLAFSLPSWKQLRWGAGELRFFDFPKRQS